MRKPPDRLATSALPASLRLRGLVAAGVALLWSACDSPSKAPRAGSPAGKPAALATSKAPSAGDAGQRATPAQPAGPAATSAKPLPKGGRVIVDRSLSMAGYAQAGESAVESVHRAVLQAFSQSGVTPVDYCDLSQNGPYNCGLDPDPNRYRSPKGYGATESQLTRVLAPIAKDAPPRPDGTIPVSPVDERGVTVVVTDGLEARNPNAAHGGKRAVGDAASDEFDPTLGICMPGTDTYCLQRILQRRAADGYGVWLIAISMPFLGRVYVERGLDASLFERVDAHLRELRTQAQWADIAFEAKRLQRNPKTGNDSYEYRGARPLLLFLMTKDIELGRAIIHHLWAEIEREPLALPAKAQHWVELAPFTPGRFGFKSLQRLSQDERARQVLPVGKAVRDPQGGLRATYECRGSGAAVFEMQAITLEDARPPWPPSLRESLDVRLARAPPAPEEATRPQKHAAKLGAYVSGVQCAKLPTGETELEYELVSAVQYEKVPDGEWWDAWNAQNTYETPERIYRIADLVEALHAGCARSPVVHDRVRLRLIRKP